MSIPGNAYRVTFVSRTFVFDGDGLVVRDARGNSRYVVEWKNADGATQTARTRGFVYEMLRDLEPGDIVDIIRDGRGSIIAIHKSDAA